MFRGTVTSQDLKQLVNDMADNASKNPYIVRALETIHQNANYSNLQSKLREEGAVVIPNAVTLAFVLERMTSAMNENWRFLKVCKDIWSEYDNLPKFISSTEGDPFFLAKQFSIEQVTKRRLLILETRNMRKVDNKTFYNFFI